MSDLFPFEKRFRDPADLDVDEPTIGGGTIGGTQTNQPGFDLSSLIAQLDPEDQALLQATSGGEIAGLLGVQPSAGRFFSPSEFNIAGLQAQGAEELGNINIGFGQQRGGLLSSLAGGARQIGQRAAGSGFARAGAFGRERRALGRRGQQQLGGLQLGRREDIATSQRGLLNSLLSTIGGFRQRAAGFEPARGEGFGDPFRDLNLNDPEAVQDFLSGLDPGDLEAAMREIQERRDPSFFG